MGYENQAARVVRSGIALLAFATMILIGTTGTDAKGRATRARTLSMRATAYCEGGKTSAGTRARSGTVAGDPPDRPRGKTIRVAGLGSRRAQTFIVADTGGAVKRNEIDIFISDCARAKMFGRRRVQVRVLRRGPLSSRSK